MKATAGAPCARIARAACPEQLKEGNGTMAYSKRCIVTGAAGFIGSALARLLLKETDATVTIQRFE